MLRPTHSSTRLPGNQGAATIDTMINLCNPLAISRKTSANQCHLPLGKAGPHGSTRLREYTRREPTHIIGVSNIPTLSAQSKNESCRVIAHIDLGSCQCSHLAAGTSPVLATDNANSEFHYKSHPFPNCLAHGTQPTTAGFH